MAEHVDGIVPHTAMGQHLLRDESVLQATAQEVTSSGRAVEIGPGTGVLTRVLLEAGLSVTAYEIDRRCEPALGELATTGALSVEWRDFLQVPAGEIEANGSTIFGNIPFHISEPLTKKLSGLDFEKAVLIYGEDFANTLLAPNASHQHWSRMSMYGRSFFTVTPLLDIPKSSFSPPPRVNAALVRLERRDATSSWRSDAVARAFRAMIEVDEKDGTIASALKTVVVKPDGAAETRKGPKQSGRRTQRRVAKQGLRDMRSDYNSGYRPERPRQNEPGQEMLSLVQSTIGHREERLLNVPLHGLNNQEARVVCSAIESIVNRRTKRR